MADWQLRAQGGVIWTATGEVVLRTDARWQEYDEWLRNGGRPDPPDPIAVVPPTLTEAMDEVIDRIDAYASLLRARFLRGLSAQELAWLMEKLRQARAVQASGNPADAPALVREANKRGITLTALVTKILTKAAAWADHEADVAGAAGAHIDAVRALTTVTAVQQYDWSSTLWP
jgi:hypothetical protein